VAGTNGGDPAVAGRIVAAATALYGERGFGVSLDEIAERAGISREALDHRFPSEEALREAINERVMSVAAEVLAGPPAREAEDFEEVARRVTALVHEHTDVVRYVARGAVEGEPDGLATFDAMMAFALASFEGMADNGVLDPGLDIDWAALHVVVFNMATVLFQRAIDQHLPDSLSTRAGIQRWHDADTELFRRGFLRRDLPASA
jgi:TetR/AcrR family transcriptional regulator, regulator of cefoperazone and chloramphenicol sensitivity